MTNSEQNDSQNQRNIDLEGQKVKAEIVKLEWEAKELSSRVTGELKKRQRRVWELLIGGLVGGTLFYAWFIGFYTPLIEIQKERLQFAKDQLEFELQAALRQSSKNRDLLKEQTEYVELVGRLTGDLQTRVGKIRNRIDSQVELIQSKLIDQSEVEKDGLLKYLSGELDEIDEINELLIINIDGGKDIVEQAYLEFIKPNNSEFNVHIIYDWGFNDLASQSADSLQQRGFNVTKVEKWVEFRADGDGAMSEFFNSGVVIWYNKDHKPTNNAVGSVIDALTEVLPENVTVRRGDTVIVPGTTWYTPKEYNIQLWVF